MLFSAGGSQTWLPNADVVVVGFLCFATAATVRAVLSYDPTVVGSSFTAPSANAIDRNLIAVGNGGNIQTTCDALVLRGEGVTVNISAAGSAVIFFEPMPAE